MRGVANLGLRCGDCGSEHACRDGVCGACRLRRLGPGKRKYVFGTELLEELRQVYCGSRTEIGQGLDRLVRKTAWPRHMFKIEASRRGWTHKANRKPWTREEVELLEEKLGRVPVKTIARELRRSWESVAAKAGKLHLSRKRREGYNLSELQVVFGAPYSRVWRWVHRGLLGQVHGDGKETWVKEENVVRFLRRHAHEYDLRRVDQAWFKSMLFGLAAEKL